MKKKVKVKAPRRFVLCPHCQSRSRLIRSEFGGLQTRECKKGHWFEYDKWIADRMVWTSLTTGRIPNPYGK